MKNFTKILALLAFVTFISKQGFAQEQRRQWVYEFAVVGLTSVNEAAKLDSLVLKKTGIYTSKTNYETKKVTIAVMPGIEYKALCDVIRASGFVPDEKHAVKEETVTIVNDKTNK